MALSKLKQFITNWLHELNQPLFQNQEEVTESALSQNGVRDETFDVLKGIAIIFVILGHCLKGQIEDFAHTFHIPLFFFVAGHFLKTRTVREEIHLSIKRLIIPYIFAAFCTCIIALLKDLSNYTWADGSYSQGVILKFLFGFRGECSPHFFHDTINILWFILTMFFARCFAVFFINKIKSVKVLCLLFFFLGILGLLLEKFIFVPYCIPQGLYAASFIFTGHLVKKFRILNSNAIKIFFPSLFILWLYSLTQGGIGMASGTFPTGFVFGLLGALGAFFTLYIIVKKFYTKTSLIWRTALFCGRYSLVIYCVHAIEFDSFNWRAIAILHHIPLNHFALFQITIHTTIIFVLTFIILKIKPLREGIFQIKNFT